MFPPLPDPLARPGSERALLDVLRAKLTRDDLVTISRADYGMDASEHLAALAAIHASGDVPARLAWHPLETLELIRWSRPEDPKWKPGEPGWRGHLKRAFCCATLLRVEPGVLSSPEQQTLAPLIESCIELGDDCLDALLDFIVWRIERLRTSRELAAYEQDALDIVFLALGWIVVRVARRGGEHGDDLSAALDWFTRAGDESYDAIRATYAGAHGYQWILDLSLFDLSHDIWRRLAQRTFLDGLDRFPVESREMARLVGETLTALREADRD